MEQSHPPGRARRVLIVTAEYPPTIAGGLGTHVAELTAGLSAAGAEVTVLTPTAFTQGVSVEGNVTVHRIPVRRLLDATGGSVEGFNVEAANQGFIDYGRGLLAGGALRPEIIHCHDWHGFAAARLLAALARVPVVATVHILNDPIYRRWGWNPPAEIVQREREMCEVADALITVSRDMRRVIHSRHARPLGLIHVVHNGLDARPFDPAGVDALAVSRWRRLLGVRGRKVLLFAGRITPQKGVSALLASAARVAQAEPRARYLIAGGRDGDGDYVDFTHFVEHLKHELFPQYGEELWSRVEFLGKVSRAELAVLYQLADLVVVPSIYENSPYATFEAMAAGRPIVASAAGGLPEIVVDGETGLLVPIHESPRGLHVVDVDKLTEVQLALLNDEPRARRMGEAGRRRLLEEFGLEKMCRSTAEVYERVIADFRVSGRAPASAAAEYS
jgi:phthiocerol/phenolphthiocerol synthesis type-I polyketide synthase E